MDHSSKIIVTGAAGFIGSYMIGYLNHKGFDNIIIVDDFSDEEKKANYADKKITDAIDRDRLFEWLEQYPDKIDFVFHLGARTDTTEFDYSIHEKWNVEYPKKIWSYCTERNVPLIYASSAATYGNGELGYRDDENIVNDLKPLNPYGVSKNEFDKWAIQQTVSEQPPFWAGLKFFNVYGPNEYHKGRMASVIFHSFNQIKETGKVKLFRSHNLQYKDGGQLRDFIYVEDVAKIMYWMMERITNGQWQSNKNGIYNVGTGQARTFKDLVAAIFKSLNVKPEVVFIDTPEDIREKYQYFTEASMNKLHNAGYKEDFFSIEEGIDDYVRNFLLPHKYY